MDRKDVQPIVEILAEFARLDGALEVLVRRGDDPDVDADRLAAAETLDLLGLQHPQQLDLPLERQLADLVEEDRRAVRLLEPADLLSNRTGVGAALVAEQLALEQPGGDRRAIHPDHLLPPPGTELVNRLREDFLAAAGFTRQQHGGTGRRHLLDLRQRRANRGALGDDLTRLQTALGSSNTAAVIDRHDAAMSVEARRVGCRRCTGDRTAISRVVRRRRRRLVLRPLPLGGVHEREDHEAPAVPGNRGLRHVNRHLGSVAAKAAHHAFAIGRRRVRLSECPNVWTRSGLGDFRQQLLERPADEPTRCIAEEGFDSSVGEEDRERIVADERARR